MLEWETAAEAELGERRTTVDRYIDWMPVLAIGIGLLLWFVRPSDRCSLLLHSSAMGLQQKLRPLAERFAA